MSADRPENKPIEGYAAKTGYTPSVIRQPERPERRLSLFFIATSGLFAFLGTTLGVFMLATLSGVSLNLGSNLFFAHPYLQIYGFVVEFVVGVEFSLLPRFKSGHVASIRLGYVTYLLLTLANVLFLVSTIFPTYTVFIGSLAAVLILAGSLVSAGIVFSLVLRPRGGFPETNPLIMASSVSLVLATLTLYLKWQGLIAVDQFSPQMILLALVGFAGSMIYSVEIRSVSFRQTDYRKKLARFTSVFQILGIVAIFLSIILTLALLSIIAAVLFLIAGLSLILTIKIFEFSRPLMYRPAMTKMHFSILRYNEVGLISGSLWLMFGLILGIIATATNSGIFFVRDSFIHSIAIGFIGSTIITFAPTLLPGLLAKRAPSSGLSYGPIILLNAGLIVRILGNTATLSSSTLPIWEALSGPLILGAIAWFFVVLHNVGRRTSAGQVQGVKDNQETNLELNNVRDATIKITRIGKERIVSVWFVKTGPNIYLLPIHGRNTKWFQDALSNPTIRIEIGGHVLLGEISQIVERKEVNHVIDLFEGKYGERVYKNLYGDDIDCAAVVAIKGL